MEINGSQTGIAEIQESQDKQADIDESQVKQSDALNMESLNDAIVSLSSSVHQGRARPEPHSELLAKKELLTAQTLSFEATKQMDEELWRSQTQAFNAICARLLNSKKSSNQLANYLTIRCKRLSGLFAHDFNDVTFGEGELGTLKQATVCLEQLTKSGQKQFSEAQSKVFDETVKKAKDLAKVLQHRSDELRLAADKHRDAIINERQVMLSSWNSYEQAMRESLVLESEVKPVPKEKDPYLLARRFLHDLALYRGGQANYSRAMKKIFDEVRLHDGRRISGLKEILLDNLLAEKNILINTMRLLDESLNAVKSIDREADVQAFLQSASELCLDEQGKMIFDRLPKSEVDSLIVERLRSHVQHKGILQRQGKLVRSNYKLGQAVITLSGFLLFFDKREDPLPALRLSLKGATVRTAEDPEPNCFELCIRTNSFLRSYTAADTYRFKAEDSDNLNEWILNIRDCIERVTPVSQS